MITAALSHAGNVRPTNQDGYLVARRTCDDLLIVAVADGMGGHRAGNVASAIATQTLREFALAHPEQSGEALAKSAVAEANARIYEHAQSDEDFYGMGTTLSLALVRADAVAFGHVGDSRIYKIGAGGMTRVTHDHSLVQQLVDIGSIDEETAAHHPQKNIITRAVGTSESVEADAGEVRWEKGDMLLVCSDGLSGEVDDNMLFSICSDKGSLEDKVRRLVDAALEAGGYDNITAILVLNSDGVGE